MIARFIVGTGRCGSTLLSSMLGDHPAVLSLQEVFSAIQPNAFPPGELDGSRFWKLLSEPREDWSVVLHHRWEPREFLYPVDSDGRFNRETGVPPIAAICLSALTDEPDELYCELEAAVRAFPEADAGAHYRRLFEWLASRLERDVWIERSGGSLLYVRELISRFEGARFVHIHRDGRETAISMSRHPFFRLQVDPRAADPTMDIPIEAFGRRWSATILRGVRVLARLPPDRVMHVAYEQILESPGECLQRLADFLDLPESDSAWLQRASLVVTRQRAYWPTLAESERKRLAEVCAVGARTLGDGRTN